LERIADLKGPNNPQQCVTNPGSCGEANLDVQYLMSVAEQAPTTFWSIEGPASKQAPFLDWIMQVANTTNPPLVHSVSYGGIEDPRAKTIFDRFNKDVMKQGARGLSILVSSGDDGVANFVARADPSKCGFNPAYPASSPYVTSVGATQGPEVGKKEVACCSDTGGLITTGGGVSNVFPMPDYQKTAVEGWKKRADKLPPSHMFSQTGRVYPDVSMAGHNYVVALGGQFAVVSGTSASAPVLAAFITLINGERLAAGKKPLGFLNPVLYKLAAKYPNIFNDVVKGDNKCCAGAPGAQTCCQYGFQATKGFDPTTGHGSPSYEPLKKALMDL
jgi:tripeptidyl-peptidase-1